MSERWLAAMVKCCICNKQWAAVYQDGTPEQELECPRCHKQFSEVLEYG